MLFGNRTIESGRSRDVAGWENAFPFKSNVNGVASSIVVYVDSHNQARRITAALYSDSKGRPGALVVAGSRVRPNAGAWNTVPVASKQVKPGRYWVAVLGADGTMYLRDRLDRPCRSARTRELGAPLSSWRGRGSTSKVCSLSVYVAGRRIAETRGATGPVGTGTTTTGEVNAPVRTAAPLAPAVTLPPVDTSAPTISGSAVDGDTLTAAPGSWINSPISYAYQWQDCTTLGLLCTDISGATSSSYALTRSDVGSTVRVVVTGANPAGSTPADSAQTGKVVLPPAPANNTLPAVSGSAVQGQTLSTSIGSWSNNPTRYSYAWKDCNSSGASCTPIASASGSSYTLASGDVGHTIRSVVTATNDGGSGAATSAQTAVIKVFPPSNTALPSVSGSVQQGQTLSTTNGSWSGSPAGYVYAWEDCNSAGAGCTTIAGATLSSYVLAGGDVGDTIRSVVTASNAGGSSSASSAPTAVVQASSGGGGGAGAYSLPAGRTFAWNPGLNAVGGIPDASWTQSGATIQPSGDTSGATDTNAIQTALDHCPADGVVRLGLGVFHVSDPVSMENSYCVLRGSGPGPGNWPVSDGTPAAASGTGGTYLESTGAYAPMVVMGPRYGNNGAGTPTNLTADGSRGATSVTVASTAGLVAGGLAVIDQVSGNTTVSTAVSNVNTFTSGSPGVLHVASTANFPASGTVDVVTSGGVAALTYTGLSGGNALTGCVFADGQAGSVKASATVLDSSLAHWNSQVPENNSGWFEEPNRPIGDVMEIASVTGNTVHFTTPLPIAYNVSQSAHLLPLINVVHDVGVENLYIYGATGGDGGGAVHMWNCDHCWVDHIEASQNDEPINMEWSFGDEVRDSYIHDGGGGFNAGSASYGIVLSFYTSNALIENNIVMRFDKLDAMRSAGGGNVFGYNYMDVAQALNGDWSEDALEGNHMTTPHYELFEGNEAPNADTADTWGNSIDITYYRNYLTGEDCCGYAGILPVRAAGLSQYDGWYSFVGNVLGEPSDSNMAGYEAVNGDPNWTGYEWQLCGLNSDDNVPDGGECMSTLLRDGNYDYYSKKVHWHGIGGTGVNNGLTPPANSTLPNSLYLSGKPAFFGSTPWPWVAGSNAASPLPGTLPAKARYDASTPNTLP